MLNNPLLPTVYLAPIKYYAILLQAKNCIIEHHEHFIKQSIRNRCEIYGANGKLRLTVPKERKGSSKTIISKIKISYKDDWQKLHWNAIKSAYNSSPFFEYYSNEIEVFYKKKENNLIVFNNKLQEVILDLLQEENNSTPSVEYLHIGNFTDLRNHDFILENSSKYNQVFMEKYGFIPNLSILDLLFNLGPQSSVYLHNIDISI